ncbi:MAG TPA: hypothetical protein VGH54_21195 [Mycobacterium sp.]|uniref:hypothetical protein n=1 Tax=Mycobacterium sp. TaxID=1785 RepID=UPI002F42907E
MKLTGALIALATVFLAACSSSHPKAAAVPSPPATTSVVVASSSTAAPTTASATVAPIPPAAPFPRGYPKIVAVSSLPDQIKSWYESDYTRAVAIAPGVWTALPAGATMQDAIAAGILDGFCASIKAYERKYLDGASAGGTCW